MCLRHKVVRLTDRKVAATARHAGSKARSDFSAASWASGRDPSHPERADGGCAPPRLRAVSPSASRGGGAPCSTYRARRLGAQTQQQHRQQQQQRPVGRQKESAASSGAESWQGGGGSRLGTHPARPGAGPMPRAAGVRGSARWKGRTASRTRGESLRGPSGRPAPERRGRRGRASSPARTGRPRRPSRGAPRRRDGSTGPCTPRRLRRRK